MVSLVNFKTVDDELEFNEEGQQQHHTSVLVRVVVAPESASQATPAMQVSNAPEQQQQQVITCNNQVIIHNNRTNSATSINHAASSNDINNMTSVQVGDDQNDSTTFKSSFQVFNNQSHLLAPSLSAPKLDHDREHSGTMNDANKPTLDEVVPVSSNGNFVVTWRKLRYIIEPKWHQKLINLTKSKTSSKPSSGIDGNQQQQEMDVSSNYSSTSANNNQATDGNFYPGKVVLDELDGSFKSGELTAILGPSGAGKTTLLDCLTGHKRSGLSGSVRISGYVKPEDGSTQANDIASYTRMNQASGQENPISERNLRVSIIPQNDHLMGHLSVYETLNYASKMKNCFERNFNHKANIKQIAQQLGLASCLGTRINKLSGGQYKRVSIAQELLSNPDVLILDEPTSGLDAMTCYQTVEVLRKLTQQRQNQHSNRQMAVILTIHQPNSDVFQQFNHVYVVAQGGKCIFEGPPSSIDSAIGRIGIQLPSANYNPATLIVEVAAGKFGLEAIDKLNNLQRKQYKHGHRSSKSCKRSTDEQTSTGDSAVECPSSTSSVSFGNDNDSELTMDDDASGEDNEEDDNNNNDQHEDLNNNTGHINRAFMMEAANESGATSIVVNLPDAESKTEVGRSTTNNVVDRKRPRVKRSQKKNHHLQISSHDSNYLINEQASGQPNNQDDTLMMDTHKRLHDDHQDENNRNQLRTRHPNITHQTPITYDNTFNNNKSSSGGGGGDDDDDDPKRGGWHSGDSNQQVNSDRPEKRLKLNSLKAGQNFPFWRHTYLHFHRSWVSIVRDPMLCGMQLVLHILVPLMVSLVYGSKVGQPNACPRAGPVDIMAYALEPNDSALQLQEDLRTTLENIGYIFFKLYGIIFAAMTVTVLTFPLDMHVLVKEFRNGWYGLSSYFIGRTLADVPFQLTLPLLAMSLSYYATGQPSSYMQWRFLSITGILILSSLIAQSQGLLFGAILMDRMKAAVFVAPAATTPIILFAGFLVRTQSIPSYLRPLSNLSYLRYAIEACLISRYGFNQCECDPAVFNRTVPELPPMARSMLDYWLQSFKPAADDAITTTIAPNSLQNSSELTTGQPTPDLFGKLMDSLARANSFGRNITSCDEVVPYPMIDYNLKDSQLFYCFAILTTMLVVTRLLTFFIVSFKVKRKV